MTLLKLLTCSFAAGALPFSWQLTSLKKLTDGGAGGALGSSSSSSFLPFLSFLKIKFVMSRLVGRQPARLIIYAGCLSCTRRTNLGDLGQKIGITQSMTSALWEVRQSLGPSSLIFSCGR